MANNNNTPIARTWVYPQFSSVQLYVEPFFFIILDPLRVVCVTDYPCESLPFGSVVHG